MDNDLVFGDKPAKKARAKKPAAPKVDVKLSDKPSKNKQSGWPIIMIDEAMGHPNFEVVGINGHIYQIMRSVEVPVPPEVVEVLKHAEEHYIIQSRGPTGMVESNTMKKSAIPWRIVGYVP